MMIHHDDRTLRERFQFIPSLLIFLVSLFMINALLHIVLKDILNCGRDYCLGGSRNSWSFVLLDSYLLAMLLTCTAFVKFKYKTFQRLGLAFIRPGVRHFIYGLIGGIGVGALYFYFVLGLDWYDVLWRAGDIFAVWTEDYEVGRQWYAASIVVLHVIALAFTQEVGYRGVLLPSLISGFGVFIGVVASSIAFGLSQPLPPESSFFSLSRDISIYSAFAFTCFGVFSSCPPPVN